MDQEVRSLEGLLEFFLKNYHQKKQLAYLMKCLPITVSFHTNSGNYQITFTKEQAYFTVGFEKEKYPSFKIYGSNEIIKELLLGKRKLRLLVSQQELTVKASLRTVLMLESIFYLTSKGLELDDKQLLLTE